VERGSVSKNLLAAARESPRPRARVYVESVGTEPLAVHCRQCADAPCLDVCPSGALRLDKDSGCSYIQPDQCLCCWLCVAACPLGVIAPAVEKQAAEKCDRCFQMPEPYCLAACPTKALKLLTAAEIEKENRLRRRAVGSDEDGRGGELCRK
jgi:carbon-monoxide dehydrogenase iron sulfur subunit